MADGQIRVRGALDGVVYEVTITGDPGRPVVGSRRVETLVEQWEGRRVRSAVTGPAFRVSGSEPRSVLALLLAKTRVLETDGTVEDGPRRVGVIT